MLALFWIATQIGVASQPPLTIEDQRGVASLVARATPVDVCRICREAVFEDQYCMVHVGASILNRHPDRIVAVDVHLKLHADDVRDQPCEGLADPIVRRFILNPGHSAQFSRSFMTRGFTQLEAKILGVRFIDPDHFEFDREEPFPETGAARAG